MPLICLVRHGQASFGAKDYDVLSDLGREQATAVGRELARRGLRNPHLVSGTLIRQRDTARLLADAAGFSERLHEDSRWNEFDHLALMERYPEPALTGAVADSRAVQDVLDRALRAWMEDTDKSGAGWAAFAEGAATALTELSATLGKGRDAVVVTSGGVLAALCGTLLSLPPAGVVALNRVIVNASVTTLVSGASGTSLLTFNDHAHYTGDRHRLRTYR
ncbi:histidine phosphatase family protein [Streptomyces sp. GC420]|uniref:histidine phosphatase family protein n=1 Tax=Streptomyces sp. GC420 TaxID=2697568 RepID=UPI001414DA6D|nr:histidine phosphatase family protein [Streptomyces sp. GC420]NBM17285.1 histidine phosphatase family protein [Streptomyces sp. GC420]